MSTRRINTVTAGLLLAAAALSACGDDEGGDSTEATSQGTAGGTGDGTTAPSGTGGEAGACDPADVVLIGQVRNETNPYEKSWLDGGDAFAESVNLSQKRLTYDGDSQKQQDQIRQELSSGNTECTVLNVLPNGDADTPPIVSAADEASAWLVTQWNKPADLSPSEYDRWVSHLTYNGEESGYQIATAMFEEMGGSGGVIALQGILDTSAAKDRFAGLEKALEESPDVELLEDQTANFSRTEALNVTRTLLTKHGDDLTGIWAANDDMALGAIQALEAAGRDDVAVVGIDAVPQAIEAIEGGTMTATVSSDGPWQGGVGLAMGYCAAIGEIDVASLESINRAFYAEQFLVTADNAGEFASPEANLEDFSCDAVFNRASAELP